MKTSTALFFALFMSILPLNAQKQKMITIKAGTRLIDYFPVQERYRYPQFINGTVRFKDYTSIQAKLNYNILFGEMQFLQKKDTLSISNVKMIENIQIAADTFYYNEGYIQVVSGKKPVYMGKKEYLKIMDTKKEGAYGNKSSTTSVTNYSGIEGGSKTIYKLTVNQDVVVTIRTEFYIGNIQDGFTIYKKSSMLKLYPDKKGAIDSYLKNNPVNFKDEQDLKRLTEFLQTI